MPRTTLDIDGPVLRELKRLQARENKTLGELASELLAQALVSRRTETRQVHFRWSAAHMGRPLVDLRDKDAVWAALDEGRGGERS